MKASGGFCSAGYTRSKRVRERISENGLGGENSKNRACGIAGERVSRLEWLGRNGLVLTIRLSRIGKKKKAFYRVVVIERTRPRDVRVRELVGTYDPLKNPAEVKLNAERIQYWLGKGVQPSDTVRRFLRMQKIGRP